MARGENLLLFFPLVLVIATTLPPFFFFGQLKNFLPPSFPSNSFITSLLTPVCLALLRRRKKGESGEK